MKNRFDIDVRKGYAVTYHLPRGGKGSGIVARIARSPLPAPGAEVDHWVHLTNGTAFSIDDVVSAAPVVPSWQEVDPRGYDAPTALRVDFGRADGPRWCVVGTAYGYLHTAGGDIRTWGSRSGAQRAARAYSARA